MGCAFDMHSTSWTDRSYVITLFVLCWVIPLVVIFMAYIGIIYRVKTSFVANKVNDNGSSSILNNDARSTNLHRDSETSRTTASYRKRVSCLFGVVISLRVFILLTILCKE